MIISVIIVGLNEWERYTKPCIYSLQAHDQQARIIVVDNGSDPPYPRTLGTVHVRSNDRLSYAGGINLGLTQSQGAWSVICNNDLIFNKALSHRFSRMDPDVLYGFKRWSPGTAGIPVPYLAGWCLFVSDKLRQAIGDFDPECKPMWFEDADYSHRAVMAGFRLEELDREDWGIRHLEDERMGERVGYMQKHIKARNAARNHVRRKHGWL